MFYVRKKADQGQHKTINNPLIYMSIHLPINISIHPSIYLSFYLSTYLSMYMCFFHVFHLVIFFKSQFSLFIYFHRFVSHIALSFCLSLFLSAVKYIIFPSCLFFLHLLADVIFFWFQCSVYL